MYFSDDRSARMIFDQVTESYLEARPEYPQESYDYVLSKMFDNNSISRMDNALEVGSGSGQASEKLSTLSKSLDCIEPGENFVKLLNKKFKDNDTITIYQSTFEEFQSDKKYDLIFSGCALHWIPKKIVLDKSETLLKNGGWIVGVWNMPKFESTIYKIIENIVHPLYPDFEIPRGTDEQIKYFDEGYKSLTDQNWVKQSHKKIFYNTRTLNNELLLKLIWSYMDIEALGKENIESVYQQLDHEIQALGIKNHVVENCYPLAMAQKNNVETSEIELNYKDMTEETISRIIEMAWEDRTPFEAIQTTYDVSESEVIKLMRKTLKPSSFRMWRKRITGRKTKHQKLRSPDVSRGYCPTQYKQR